MLFVVLACVGGARERKEAAGRKTKRGGWVDERAQKQGKLLVVEKRAERCNNKDTTF
jgi:hypothetical protein